MEDGGEKYKGDEKTPGLKTLTEGNKREMNL
jgi:hypothetical protein